MATATTSRTNLRLMVPSVACVVALTGAAALVAPQAIAHAQLSPLAQKHAPAPEPDRLITTLTGDPATTRTVTWRTDDSIAQGDAQVIEATELVPEDFDGPAPLPAETTPLATNLGYTSHHHRIDFEGLTPSTGYLYRVGDAETSQWSAWTPFDTAADQAEDFQFTYLGDAQNDIEEAWTRVAQQAYRDGNASELLVHPGDLIDVGTRDEEWGEWATAASPQVGSIPTLAAAGNHEYFVSSGPRQLSEHWRLMFPGPDNAPEGDEDFDDTVYSVDYQGVRFISLNSAYRETTLTAGTAAQQVFVDAQAEWLEGQLADNPNQWTVVFFHHPTYSTASGRNNQLSRDAWKPIFEEYGVDLVLSGHDHTYGRGWTNTGARSDVITGPVYINSVSGPKMYDVSGDNWTDNGATIVTAGEDTQLYQLIDVTDRGLRVVSKTATGEFFDGFEVSKRGGDSKRVLELDADDF